MRLFRSQIVSCAIGIGVALAYPAVAQADLIPGADGSTVYDTTLRVIWLANANLAGSANGAGTFGVSGIETSGAMTYATALDWVPDV